MPDEEIFDFTDSRSLHPPADNIRNFPEVALINIGGQTYVTPAPVQVSSPSPIVSPSPGTARPLHPTPQPIFKLPEHHLSHKASSQPVHHVPQPKTISQLPPPPAYLSTIKPFVHLGSPKPTHFSTTPRPEPYHHNYDDHLSNQVQTNNYHAKHQIVKQLPLKKHLGEIRALEPRYRHRKKYRPQVSKNCSTYY